MPLIFQYGSNCDRERLNGADRLNGDADDLGPVQTVDEYEIAFNKWSTTGNYAAADLLKPRKGGRGVWGVLYQVSRAGFRKLKDKIEGRSYRPQSIVVEDATGATKSVKTFASERPNAVVGSIRTTITSATSSVAFASTTSRKT